MNDNSDNSVVRRQRVSRDDWLAAALEILAVGGIETVKIDRLAKRLGVAKSGFYWHFKNRSDLQEQILRHWQDVYTKTLTDDAAFFEIDPATALRLIAARVDTEDLAQYDLAISEWSKHDDRAKAAYRSVIEMRLSFVSHLFESLGFSGTELEMRAHLFVGYHSTETSVFLDLPHGDRKTLRKQRLDFLLSGAPNK